MRSTDRTGFERVRAGRAARVVPLAALPFAAALMACESGPTEPAPDDVDMILAVAARARAEAPAVLDPSEPYEQACPAGGRFLVDGEATHTFGDDGSVHTWDEVMTHEDCGLEIDGDVVVANGAMHLWGEARFGPPVGGFAPVEAQESFQVGTMSTTREGHTVSCDYDLAFTFDPDIDRYRITGTACGRAVELTAPATP